MILYVDNSFNLQIQIHYFQHMLKTVLLLLCAIVCAGFCSSGDTTACYFPVAATFSEDIITLSWPDVPDAAAYNVYVDFGNGHGRIRANFSPVRSRTRFGFIWIESNGKKERVVKGNKLRLYVVPLFSKGKKTNTVYTVGRQSCSVANSYYTGFSNVLDSGDCHRILQPHQATQKVLARAEQSTQKAFCDRYGQLAHDIDALYRSKINPRDEGACVPFSTMVAKYFTARGIPCYRAQGMFIGAFHSFNIVVVDGVEYVLDFTADQFVPGSAPVFMPRDFCCIDSCGSPTGSPHGTWTKIYRIEKVFASDKITFTDTPKAREYQHVLDSLLNVRN
jgi:hypothetical protein